jgi:hypothetical protein
VLPLIEGPARVVAAQVLGLLDAELRDDDELVSALAAMLT